MLLGLGLGAVVFRVRHVRGELFALLTLATTLVLATIVLNTPVDGGPGVYLSAVPVPKLAPTPSGALYMIALVLAIGTLAIAYAFAGGSGWGSSPYDDEDAAESWAFDLSLQARRVRRLLRLAGVAGGIQACSCLRRRRRLQHRRALTWC
jgi:branched-chain amino acid transport system permease protein